MVSIAVLVTAATFTGGRPASAATPVHQQSTAKKITSGSANSVSFGNANAAGNLIVAYVVWDNAGSVTLTDARNSYSAVAPARDAAGAISWQSNLLGTDKLHNVQVADLNGDCKVDFFGAYSLSSSTPVIVYRSTGGNAC